jgi:2-dehydro-3-deoxygluconokinase
MTAIQLPGNFSQYDPSRVAFATLGEIMLRLSAPGQERLLQSPWFNAQFGGGEANVAVSLAVQGFAARFITALPHNELGHGALRTLRGYGVDTSAISLRSGTRLGLYFLEKGANQRPSRVVYDRADSAMATAEPESFDWSEALSGAHWFHITGITPALSPSAAELTRQAMAAAREQGLVVSLDLNYRGKLWQYGVKAPEIMRELTSLAHVVVANEEDVQKSLAMGTEIDPSAGEIRERDYLRLMESVFKEFAHLHFVAITLRESISASHNRWGGCISDGEHSHFSRKYDITHIVDRVGGGDSFCAGLMAGMALMESMEDALEYAVAASSLTHSIEGDINLSTREEILSLWGGDASGRIKR